MPILRPVRKDKQDATAGEIVDQVIQHRLRAGIGPVEIFNDQDQRPSLTLPHDEHLQRLECALALLRWTQCRPLRISAREVEQRGQWRQHRDERTIQASTPRRSFSAFGGIEMRRALRS